jgi:hypothetical protein
MMLSRLEIPVELALASSIESIRKCVLVVIDRFVDEERGTGSKCRDTSNDTTIQAGAHVATVVWFSLECSVKEWRSVNR